MNPVLVNFHFIRPEWLWLLPLVIGLWLLWQRRADPLYGWREQMDPDFVRALSVGHESTVRGPGRYLLAGWLCAVIAIAGPTWRPEPSPFADDATPLMILLKADASMDRPDPAPSRLERAQLKITDLAAAREGQPLGLIAYAGSAHLVLPPTRDTAVVAQLAAEISSAIMPVPGDRLDLALLQAAEILGSDAGNLVVFADSVSGEDDVIRDAAQTGRFGLSFLAIDSPGSPEFDSIRSTAKNLGADVQALTADDTDIDALVRAAANTPIAQAGDSAARWQEAGWFLMPFIALIFVGSFRREVAASEAGP